MYVSKAEYDVFSEISLRLSMDEYLSEKESEVIHDLQRKMVSDISGREARKEVRRIMKNAKHQSYLPS